MERREFVQLDQDTVFEMFLCWNSWGKCSTRLYDRTENKALDLKHWLRTFKKTLICNGTLFRSPEEEYIVLSGDRRRALRNWNLSDL